MTIKTWGDRLAEMPDGAITTSHHVTCAMQDEIDELRASNIYLKRLSIENAQSVAMIKAGHARDTVSLRTACDSMEAELAALNAQPVQGPAIVGYPGYPSGMGNEPDDDDVQGPMQEPVAWLTQSGSLATAKLADGQLYGWTPLYAAPVQPAPLTDEQIGNIYYGITHQRWTGVTSWIATFARAIETAIKGGAT